MQQVLLLRLYKFRGRKKILAAVKKTAHYTEPILLCTMPTIELSIYGKVQGVFYRDRTRKKAVEMGLSGWVRNEPDGSVRVRATGPLATLALLESWCTKGPERAVVQKVVRKDIPEEAFNGFSILR
jgi:acylphosphatase